MPKGPVGPRGIWVGWTEAPTASSRAESQRGCLGREGESKPPNARTTCGGSSAGRPSPLAEKTLGGLVCRFQLGKVHREIKHHLDRFGVGMGVIVAVNVHLELLTVANDPLPPRLE
jgi:hypothetical protein